RLRGQRRRRHLRAAPRVVSRPGGVGGERPAAPDPGLPGRIPMPLRRGRVYDRVAIDRWWPGVPPPRAHHRAGRASAASLAARAGAGATLARDLDAALAPRTALVTAACLAA